MLKFYRAFTHASRFFAVITFGTGVVARMKFIFVIAITTIGTHRAIFIADIKNVVASIAKFLLIHSLAGVPMNEGLLFKHRVKLVEKPEILKFNVFFKT